ncbi:MAG: hypothetical protein Q9223_005311 [Gallowayella weberi]
MDKVPSLQQQGANLSISDSLTARPRFTWKVHIKLNARLDPVPMMMMAADALTIIALRDHRGRSRATNFRHTEGFDIVIDLVPKSPAIDVSNEVAILCIYYGMEDMIRHRQFQECTFACELDDVEVAVVNIWNESSTPEAVKGSSMTETTNLTQSLLHDLQPHFSYIDGGADISISVAFVTVMDSIMTLASFRGADVVPPGHTDPGPAWGASVIFPGDGPARRRPPFFEYRYVIDTLNLGLHYMLGHRRSAELRLYVAVDGEYLGRAFLLKGKPWPTTPLLSSIRTASA